MADKFDCIVNSNLLCEENTNTCFDDDLGCNATDEFGLLSPTLNIMPQQNKETHNHEPSFDHNRSESLMSFPLQSEDTVRTMVDRESEHLPRGDYLTRLRSGDLDLSVRREALDWIWKVWF